MPFNEWMIFRTELKLCDTSQHTKPSITAIGNHVDLLINPILKIKGLSFVIWNIKDCISFYEKYEMPCKISELNI